MEFGGLIVALIAGAVMLYALPAIVSKRGAVVASREGDRFSPDMDLIRCELPSAKQPAKAGRNATQLLPRPATRPLLPTMLAATSEGRLMSSNSEANLSDHTTAFSAADSRARHMSATQQMAALRARRAARLSSEQAAVKRRILATGTGAVLMLIFVIAAAAGALSWWWLLFPTAILAGTVASSVLGSRRAQEQNAAEIQELAEVKQALAAHRPQPSRPQPASKMKREVQVAAVEEDAAASSGPSNPDEGPRERPRKTEEDEVVDIVLDVEDTDDVDDPASEDDQEPEQQEAPVEESTVVESEPEAANREWDVVELPPVRGSGSQVQSRRVHADTDLLPTLERRTSGVPARPLRRSEAVAAASKTAAQATGPSFKFDLDAVLDQRRAQ